MKNPFKPGDRKEYFTKVTADKLAEFEAGVVHPVYGTFALGKDAEWACRLFVLEMKEEGEEGIGTYLSVEHISAAPLGSEIRIVAELEKVENREVVCSYVVFSGSRKIARGRQIQKIIDKARFDDKIQSLLDGIS